MRQEEQLLIDKLSDLVERLNRQYAIQLTDFLDPAQQALAASYLTSAGVTYYSSVDYYPLEYARLLLAPDYYQLDWADFDLALIAIDYQGKFSQLSHSQILGTLVKGLGLERRVIGDILVREGQAQLVLQAQLVPYLMSELSKIAGVGVRLKQVGFGDLLLPQEEQDVSLLLASSLRLDKLVALVTKLSRRQAQELIELGKVKVNYQESLKGTQELTKGDLLSVRGYGRFRLADHLGRTKSDKHKLMIERLTRQ